MRFSLSLILTFVVLLFAHGGKAATLTLTADQTAYNVGETVTLTVTGTIDPTTEATTHIDVRLALGGSFINFLSSTADQALNPVPLVGPQTGWTVAGSQGQFISGNLVVINQIQGLAPGGTFVNNFNGVDEAFITATVLLTLSGPGAFDIDFATDTDFFGIGPGPGITLNTGIPEPASAALLGLGLLGLATTQRRRACRVAPRTHILSTPK